MPEEKKEAPRYIVSVGEYKNEKLALERRKTCLDAGLRCEIIDAEESDMEKLYAAILLLAEQVKRMSESVTEAIVGPPTRVQMVDEDPDVTIISRPIMPGVNPDWAEFGAKIKATYTQKGFKANQLADILGVQPGTFSKWICGRAKIPQDKLEKLCTILQVKESDLKGE